MRELVLGVFIVALLVGGVVVWTIRYQECRAHGFSMFYCWMQK